MTEKHSVVLTHDGTSFSLEEEGHPDTGRYAKCNKPVTKRTDTRFYVYEESRTGKFRDRKWSGAARNYGRGVGLPV